MGYFKNWQNTRNIHEAVNHLPGGQGPQPPQGFDMTPHGIGQMERQVYLNKLKEFQQASKGALFGVLGLEPIIEEFLRGNPQAAEYWQWIKSGAGTAAVGLANLVSSMEGESLSQKMVDKRGVVPPSSIN